MVKKHKIRSLHNEAGAALAEYAIYFAVLLPIFLAAAYTLYNTSGDEPEGAIVNRGNASLVPVKEMAPTREKLCEGDNKQWCY